MSGLSPYSPLTSRDGSLDVAESTDLEVGHGVGQVVGGEREERQQRGTHDLRTALHDRPSTAQTIVDDRLCLPAETPTHDEQQRSSARSPFMGMHAFN